MPHGVHTGAAQPHDEPAPVNSSADTSQRRELLQWWKGFRHRGTRREPQQSEQLPTGIFGVPLHQSIRYANVAISLFDEEGNSYVYGYVPIVVAKCGVFLKERATEVEGIFRLSGSEKRIKELKVIFDSPERYGKGLSWDGFTVHDAANILRRYFNNLPEPIVPLDFYERFRAPLRGYQEQAVGSVDGQTPAKDGFDESAAIAEYQRLITALPPLNRQLLLYILDLLAVFASKSDLNKMTTPNLAAIFQPGTLSHPQHDMAPGEYRLSQDVLTFLIENQDHFLIGMRGTEADAQTVQEVESGPPTPQEHAPSTPGRSKGALGRSGSNASVGPDSVRQYGGIRRNKSVSSKHSRNSSNLSPATPIFQSSNNTGAVHRSNTLPTKRSPAVPTARFNRDRTSGPVTPTSQTNSASIGGSRPESATNSTANQAGQGLNLASPSGTQQPAVQSSNSALAPNLAVTGPTTPLSKDAAAKPNSVKDSTSPSETQTPESSISKAMSGIGGLFTRSPSAEPRDGRKPNKLQKKRMPGSANPSAQSSTHSLSLVGLPNDGPMPPIPSSSVQNTPHKDQLLQPQAGVAPQRLDTNATVRPSVSPAHSFRSRSTTADADHGTPGLKDDDGITPTQEQTLASVEKKTRKFHMGEGPIGVEQDQVSSTVGGNSQANVSHTSLNSAGEPYRKSFQGVASDGEQAPPPIGEERERKGSGPMKWIRGKMAERQERKEEKARAKSPEVRGLSDEEKIGSVLSLNSSPPRDQQTRGRSFEVSRGLSGVVSAQQAKEGEVVTDATQRNGSAAPVPTAADSMSAVPTAQPVEEKSAVAAAAPRV